MFDQRALIIGGTGIVGNNLARHLVSQGLGRLRDLPARAERPFRCQAGQRRCP